MVSGYDSSVVETSDPAVLLRALGRPVSADEIAAIAPWRFRAPLSPDLAAARERPRLDFDALVAFSRARRRARTTACCSSKASAASWCRSKARRTVLDWMAALEIPLLLVVGGYLGTISHTLTALDVAARSAGSPSRRSW